MRARTESLIWLETTRHAVVLRRILEEYGRGATVRVDGREFAETDIPALVSDWCTNRRIRETRNFSLFRDGEELFGFHDSPDELWAAASELSFVQGLASEGITRYTTATAGSGCFSLLVLTVIGVSVLASLG